ncbi:inorganic phosphate transporter, partial [Thioclava sp. BHET1]
MTDRDADPHRLRTLDRDLGRISNLELATGHVGRSIAVIGLAFVFIVLAALAGAEVFDERSHGLIIFVAAAFGAYMALNIGANDVANNMGPAVGAEVLTMGGAIAIAAVCETLGALLAGGDVVSTVAEGIVAPQSFGNTDMFIWAMMAALLSSALWVNCATWIGAPVSTTHSVVGGVMGAGIAAAGFGAVDWPTMVEITASWVISPLIGGVIAAIFLWFIRSRIVYRDDKIAAAQLWVPVLVGIMSATFGAYFLLKGLHSLVPIGLGPASALGLCFGLVIWRLMIPVVRWQSRGLEN